MFLLCVIKLPCFTYFHLQCICGQNFLQNNLMEPEALKSPCWKLLWIIHGLPVTDCMTAASTGITRFKSTGFPRAWLHTCAKTLIYTRTHTHTYTALLTEGCSVRVLCAFLLTSCRYRLSLWLFQGVGEKLLWWLWTSVWFLCEHTGCLGCVHHQRGCHSCRDTWSGNQGPFCTMYT